MLLFSVPTISSSFCMQIEIIKVPFLSRPSFLLRKKSMFWVYFVSMTVSGLQPWYSYSVLIWICPVLSFGLLVCFRYGFNWEMKLAWVGIVWSFYWEKRKKRLGIVWRFFSINHILSYDITVGSSWNLMKCEYFYYFSTLLSCSPNPIHLFIFLCFIYVSLSICMQKFRLLAVSTLL